MDLRKILPGVMGAFWVGLPAWAAEGGGLLAPNPGLAIWTLITFVALLAVLKAFAWKPLIASLENRTRHIENMIREAEEKNRKAEELFRQYQQQVEAAKKEAIAIIEEGKRDSEVLKKRQMEEARQEADTLKKQTLHEIELAKKKAKEEIWSMAVELSTGLAEKIIERSMRTEDDRRVIETVLQEYRRS